jgi:hypothetical protein
MATALALSKLYSIHVIGNGNYNTHPVRGFIDKDFADRLLLKRA